MTKLANTSLNGKFKKIIFLSPEQENLFSNIVRKEFDKTTDQHKAFDLVQISIIRNFPFAQEIEQLFNNKYHLNSNHN